MQDQKMRMWKVFMLYIDYRYNRRQYLPGHFYPDPYLNMRCLWYPTIKERGKMRRPYCK